jgi:hypothetical protein
MSLAEALFRTMTSLFTKVTFNQNREARQMPKDTVSPECSSRIIQDHTLLHDAQLAFLEEVDKCGGSFIATSHRYQMKSSEIARRACLLDLMSFWQASDYDAARKSNHNLPSYIALEDCLVAIKERHGNFGLEQDFLAVQDGVYKMRREETWSIENFTSFLRAGERLFASCRDSFGVTSVFSPIGLDALDRMSSRVLSENPGLKQQIQAGGDNLVERYFDHLSEEDLQKGHFDIISIARGENISPAWIVGKLLVMGLTNAASPTLDPVLDPETRAMTVVQMDRSPLSIAKDIASRLDTIIRTNTEVSDRCRYGLRLRLAAAEATLRQICEMTATRTAIMSALDHLDRAISDAGSVADSLNVYSFAAHTRMRNYALT